MNGITLGIGFGQPEKLAFSDNRLKIQKNGYLVLQVQADQDAHLLMTTDGKTWCQVASAWAAIYGYTLNQKGNKNYVFRASIHFCGMVQTGTQFTLAEGAYSSDGAKIISPYGYNATLFVK